MTYSSSKEYNSTSTSDSRINFILEAPVTVAVELDMLEKNDWGRTELSYLICWYRGGMPNPMFECHLH